MINVYYKTLNEIKIIPGYLLPWPRWLASPELLGWQGYLYASRKGSAGGPSWQAATRARVPA